MSKLHLFRPFLLSLILLNLAGCTGVSESVKPPAKSADHGRRLVTFPCTVVVEGGLIHVDTPVTPDAKQFPLPEEMDAFREEAYQSVTSTSGIRSLLACAAQYAFDTYEGPTTCAQDYVSTYDFLNANLDDFPFEIGATAGIISNQLIEFVDKLERENCRYSMIEYTVARGIDAHSEFVLGPLPTRRNADDTRLQNGWFRGSLETDGDQLVVKRAAREEEYAADIGLSFELINWRFVDVNRDGILDVALLYLVDDWAESRVLTRTSPNQTRFSLVKIP